jgi:hypothetical protein
MSKHKSTDRKLTAVKYYLKGKKSSWGVKVVLSLIVLLNPCIDGLKDTK